MKKTAVFIIAPNKFRDEELNHPKEILENQGIAISVASKNTKNAVGALGAKVKVDLDVSEIDIRRYDALILVGGEGAMLYFNDPQIHKIVKDAYKKEKIIGAICIAPTILANSGILKGKKVTSFPTEEKNLEQKEAIYTGENITTDGQIITANGPSSARLFGKKIFELLSNNSQ